MLSNAADSTAALDRIFRIGAGVGGGSPATSRHFRASFCMLFSGDLQEEDSTFVSAYGLIQQRRLES